MTALIAASALGLASPPAANAFPIRYAREVPAATRIELETDLARFFRMRATRPSPLYQEIFGELTRAASEEWFFSRVSDVGSNLCTDESAVACVLPAWENHIFLSPNYSKFDHPPIARLMVLIHEARHTESAERNWPHAKCPANFVDEHGKPVRSIWTGAPLSGERACDLEEFGSYGIATVWLLNVAFRCENCTDEEKRDAELYGFDQLRRITWKSARDRILRDLGLPGE